jgi:hypothetical protein
MALVNTFAAARVPVAIYCRSDKLLPTLHKL